MNKWMLIGLALMAPAGIYMLFSFMKYSIERIVYLVQHESKEERVQIILSLIFWVGLAILIVGLVIRKG
jgi:hypothetical protein